MFVPVTASLYNLFSPIRERTPEENFSAHFQKNLTYWNSVDNRIRNTFTGLGYKMQSHYQYIPTGPEDDHIILCSFINDDYRVDASLKSHILEVKIQSTKYNFVGTEGDVPFMQAFNISELILMDKYTPNSLIDLHRMSLDTLEKTIGEFSLHDSTHIKYIYIPNKLY